MCVCVCAITFRELASDTGKRLREALAHHQQLLLMCILVPIA